MSGRELFLSYASLFVDDAEAYDKYQRESESDYTGQNANGNAAEDGPSTSRASADNEDPKDVDDDELDMDESNELEASLSKTSILIKE
ncbi:hypothetical protein RJT34_19866 [Clitoria ternatea]|uniref:Uncharacterized protein n=1 Tax=Clitoria ternatea TaxID=43366 RepID=A0AAN9P4D4_CLITE